MTRKRPAPDPHRAVAYIRCSTSRQDLSPEAQAAAIAEWAARVGVEIVATHEDRGVSGGVDLDRRTGLLAAIDSLRAHGAGALVVARRDRLARDVLVSAMVERLCARVGARVQSADGAGNGSGPEAALMRNIVAAFSAYERMIIRARTRAALAVKKSKGERVGGIPFGYMDQGGKLVENPAEQAVVKRARELRAGGLSLRAVGRALLAEGHQPRNGRAWHPQVLGRVVAD